MYITIYDRYFNVDNSPKVNNKQIKLHGCWLCLHKWKIAQYNKIKQMNEIIFNRLFEI